MSIYDFNYPNALDIRTNAVKTDNLMLLNPETREYERIFPGGDGGEVVLPYYLKSEKINFALPDSTLNSSLDPSTLLFTDGDEAEALNIGILREQRNRLDEVKERVGNVEEVVLPAHEASLEELDTRLRQATTDLTTTKATVATLKDVTIPAQTQAFDQLNTSFSVLKNTTVPAVETRVGGLETKTATLTATAGKLELTQKVGMRGIVANTNLTGNQMVVIDTTTKELSYGLLPPTTTELNGVKSSVSTLSGTVTALNSGLTNLSTTVNGHGTRISRLESSQGGVPTTVTPNHLAETVYVDPATNTLAKRYSNDSSTWKWTLPIHTTSGDLSITDFKVLGGAGANPDVDIIDYPKPVYYFDQLAKPGDTLLIDLSAWRVDLNSSEGGTRGFMIAPRVHRLGSEVKSTEAVFEVKSHSPAYIGGYHHARVWNYKEDTIPRCLFVWLKPTGASGVITEGFISVKLVSFLPQSRALLPYPEAVPVAKVMR